MKKYICKSCTNPCVINISEDCDPPVSCAYRFESTGRDRAEWELHQEPDHQTYQSGMKREPQKGRERFDLITPVCIPYNKTMLYRWAMLMSKGCEKYGERNWEQAAGNEELSRFKESAFRHFMKWMQGETDEDHAAAVMFNISGAEMVKVKMEDKS